MINFNEILKLVIAIVIANFIVKMFSKTDKTIKTSNIRFSDVMRLVSTPEGLNLISTPEFQSLKETNEFKGMIHKMTDNELNTFINKLRS